MKKNIYSNFSQHVIIKLLTNLDRDPMSPTYGSFDRNYWNYKIRDFSSAILQQGALTLSLIYSNNFFGNIYYNKKIVKDYAIAAIRFWTKIQYKNGGFPEYWAQEKSIPATAFSLYSICTAAKIIDYSSATLNKVIRKAVNFLLKNVEEGALNQEMAATCAVYAAGDFLKDNKIKKQSIIKFNKLLTKQKAEGWFPEYNGLDIGYLSVNLEFMVKFYQLSKNKKALDAAKKIVEITSYFIHPDGSLGGEYCTRNTEYFLPYGFEYMKKYTTLASSILNKLFDNINRPYLNYGIDSRYILHYVSPSIIQSDIEYKPDTNKEKLPCEKIFEKYFEEAMIYIKSTKKYYFICSLAKAGTLKVIDKKTNYITTDCSYRIKHKNKLYTCEWPNNNTFNVKKGKVKVISKFIKKKYVKQTPIKQTALKILSAISSKFVISFAKKVIIYDKNKFIEGFKINRYITLNENTIIIEDEILNALNKHIEIFHIPQLSMRHTASSKFFQRNSIFNQINYKNFKTNKNFKNKTFINFK